LNGAGLVGNRHRPPGSGTAGGLDNRVIRRLSVFRHDSRVAFAYEAKPPAALFLGRRGLHAELRAAWSHLVLSPVKILQPLIELAQIGSLTGIPELKMTVLARRIEIFTGIPCKIVGLTSLLEPVAELAAEAELSAVF